jgi:hypothetical protein
VLERAKSALSDNIDVEVRPSDDVDFDHKNPFDSQVFITFSIPDYESSPEVIADYHIRPATEAMARYINGLKIVQSKPLLVPVSGPNEHCEIFDVNGVPFRLRMYEGPQRTTVTAMDAFVRQVGNYYRLIINGPLHGWQMPFVADPEDGHSFEYTHEPLQSSRPDYTYYSESLKTTVRFPDLLASATYCHSVHKYLVMGAYCYYVGETLSL